MTVASLSTVVLLLFSPFMIGTLNDSKIKQNLSKDFSNNTSEFKRVVMVMNYAVSDEETEVAYHSATLESLGYIIDRDDAGRIFFDKGYSKASLGVSVKMKCIIYADDFSKIQDLGGLWYCEELSDEWYICFFGN